MLLTFSKKEDIDKYGLMINYDGSASDAVGLIADPRRNIISLGSKSDLVNGGGASYNTSTKTLSVDNIETHMTATMNELMVTGDVVLQSKVSVHGETELGKLSVRMEGDDAVTRFIEGEAAYPELCRVRNADKVLDITEYQLNAKRGIITPTAEVSTLTKDGKTVNVQYSQTITHEAPFTGEATDYAIGDPVFASGRVCQWKPNAEGDGGEWTYTTTPIDCICELKPEGQLSEFVGVCVAFVGSDGTYKNEPDGDTNSLLFATHGDFYFNVADASKYKTGDIIMLDYNILTDDTPITGRVLKSIVGKVTGKINRTTVAILRE